MFLLAIDAGATKSHLVLWDLSKPDVPTLETALINTKYPGINLDVINSREATQRLLIMIQETAQSIGQETSSFLVQTDVVIGMAGLDTNLDFQNATAWIQSIPLLQPTLASIHLIPDVELALWAASESGEGVLLIAGTGSNCFGRIQDKTAKAGGFSHFFSDEGSGFMLGWRALHLTAQMFDGRLPQGKLYTALLQQYSEPDFAHLKRRIVQAIDYKHEVAKAAPAVQALAAQGDPDSLALIEEAVAELIVLVQTVYKALYQGVSIPVYVVGGLFQDQLFKEKFAQHLENLGISATLTRIEFPVIGAVAYQRRLPVS